MNNMQKDIELLINEFKLSFSNNEFVKLLLSKPNNSTEIEKVNIRLVEIKNELKFCFVFQYKTKHITKNFSLEESLNELYSLIGNNFKNCILFTIKNDIRLSFNKKMNSKLEYNKASFSQDISKKHNKDKDRVILETDNQYLKELGIVNNNNQISPSKQRKFKQINKYIETLENIIKNSSLKNKESITVADMGSGKGYLTFALYDYLTNNLKINASVIGVEIRKELVDFCNQVAKSCGFKNLHFYEGTINNFNIDKTDILIALHACDTATDDAIYKGINSSSEIIITAPCCHKQIRKELEIDNELSEIVKYGILKERQAEIITDTLRGLYLESKSYKTQIFEFISDEHTHKNVMIVGVKSNLDNNKKDIFVKKSDDLKRMFGIKEFYLDNLK